MNNIENPELMKAIIDAGRVGYDCGHFPTDGNYNLIANTWKDSKVFSMYSGCIPMTEMDVYKCEHLFDLLVLIHVYKQDTTSYNIPYRLLQFPLIVKFNVKGTDREKIDVDEISIEHPNKVRNLYYKHCN